MAAPTPMDVDAPAAATKSNGTGSASPAKKSSSSSSSRASNASASSSSSSSSSAPLAATGKSAGGTSLTASSSSRGKQRVADSDDEDGGAGSKNGVNGDDEDDDSDVPLQAGSSSQRRKAAVDEADDDDEDNQDEDNDDDDEDNQDEDNDDDDEDNQDEDNDDDEGNGGYDEEGEAGDDGNGDADADDGASTTSKASTSVAGGVKKAAAAVAKRLTGRSDKKWDTLYHKGPRFPPAYEPLPSGVKLKYDGKPVTLPPQAEEAAMFYAIKIETDYVKKASNAAIFNKNFFEDWKKILAKHPPANGVKIVDFSKCDFRDMYNHFKELRDAENERKKNMAPSQRKQEIEEKKKAEAHFRTCVVDGVEQKVGNFTVEPPGLFLGRGAHPKMGKIKKRIRPEDITINHTQNDPKHPPPAPPKGHKWKEIVTIKDKTWLAAWVENVNKQNKYMYLDSASLFKTNSDREKFEKARKLDNHVRQLRAEYEQMLTSKSRSERELGTVVWLIDVWSLRVGNEKNAEEEAETYGACSLLKEHITCLPVANPQTDPHWVKLSFLGKDSMKFEGQNVATPQIYKNLQLFSKGFKDTDGNTIIKKATDPLFVSVDPGKVNKFLTSHMAGLSAKVFRTYNASVTFQALLDRTDYWLASQPDPDRRILNPANLKLAYEAANYQVAVLCNHQRTLNQQQMEQAENRAASKRFNILYDRYKLRQLLLTGNTMAEIKKSYKSHDFAKRWDEIFEEVPITIDQIREHEETQAKQRKEKIMKRFERDQLEEKYQASLKKGAKPDASAKANGKGGGKKGKALDDSEVESERDEDGKKRFLSKEMRDEQLQAIDERLKTLAKERKTGKAEEASGNIPGMCKRILACVDKLKAVQAEAEAKMKTSDVALGTSKLNYIDPRITVAWLKKYDLRLQEEALKDPYSKLSREMAKLKEEEAAAAAAAKKGKGGAKGKKAKKEESDDEDDEDDVKPNGGKRGRGSNAAANGSPARKRAKVENGSAQTTLEGGAGKAGGARTNLNAIGESDKMELGLKILNLSHYFPNTMQKKFKWAATDDDDLDLRPGWQFVKDPWTKMRKPARKEGSKADNVDMWEAPTLSAKVSAAVTGKAKVDLKASLSDKMPSKAEQVAVITGPSAGKKTNTGGVRRTGKAAKKEEAESDEDDAPLVATATKARGRTSSGGGGGGRAAASKASKSLKEEDSDEDEEMPLAASQKTNGSSSAAKAKAKAAATGQNGVKKEVKAEDGSSDELSEPASEDDDDDDDDDVPLGKKI